MRMRKSGRGPATGRACGRMPQAAFLGFTARTGEMSPGSILKYLKRPLWRERKCGGCGREAARAGRGQRGGGGGVRDRGTAARAPVARNRPRARATAAPRARIPPTLPHNLFKRASAPGAPTYPHPTSIPPLPLHHNSLNHTYHFIFLISLYLFELH